MITGKELAEKYFSEKNEVEEKLYSTGNEELDELLERAFCDGYEFAQAEFSKDSDDEDKLEKADERFIKENSSWWKDGLNDFNRTAVHETVKDDLRNHISEGGHAERSDKRFKKARIGLAATTGLAGGVEGALLGSLHNGTKGALIGGGIGAAVGTGLGYGLGKYGEKRRNEVKSLKSRLKHTEAERQADLLDVADSKMSRSEYKKKWYKDEKKDK